MNGRDAPRSMVKVLLDSTTKFADVTEASWTDGPARTALLGKDREPDWPTFVDDRHLDMADRELIGSYRSWLVHEAALGGSVRRTETGGLTGGGSNGR